MEKLDPKTDGATPDIVEQNIEKLKDLFPEVFTEDGSADYADGRRLEKQKTICENLRNRWMKMRRYENRNIY